MIWAQLNGSGGHYFRRTSDGGKTWKNVYMDSAWINFEKPAEHYLVPKLREIAYPDTNLFIAVGDSGLILRSTDKGETWEKYFYDKNIRLSRIRMVDENNGYLSGCRNNCYYYSDLKLFKTSDGGLTWIDIKLPDSSSMNFGISGMQAINKDLVLLTIQYLNPPYKTNILWLNNENWNSWDTTSIPSNTTRLHFINQNTGWFAGGKKLKDSAGWESWSMLIYRTDNRGKKWQLQRDTVYNGWPVKDIKFYDENFGISGGGFSHVMVTTDGGKHWIDDEIINRSPKSGQADLVNNIEITSMTTAYVIHDYRSIYKYTRDLSHVSVRPDISKEGISISPNPAGEYIDIAFSSPRLKPWVASVDEIKIYNLLGECVINESIHPMTPSHRMNIENLPAGLYFVRVGDWVGRFLKI